MRRFGIMASRSRRRWIVLAFLGLLASTGLARARAGDASPFLAFDAESCAKLDDKNLQVGPPDAEMVTACAAFGRRAVLGQTFSGGPASVALLLAGAVLLYIVLGVPMRPVFGLLGRAGDRSSASLSIETAVIGFLRVGVAFAVLALLSAPFALSAACLAMLAAAILSLRPLRASPSGSETEGRASAVSIILADAVNDVYASAAGILGLAVLARRDPRWLAAGVALALVFSVPTIVRSRRRLRSDPAARLVTASGLAALFGAAAFADPDLSSYSGDAFPTVLAGAAAFALIVLGVGWKAETLLRSPSAGSRQRP